MMIVLVIVFLLLFLSGIFHLLQAVWELRQGSNRTEFIRRGMLGVGLIAIAFVVPYAFLIMGSVASVQQVQHFNIP